MLDLDRSPIGELHRVIAGFLVVVISQTVESGTDRGWRLLILFAGVLVAYRTVPLVIRKLVRFDDSTTAVWSERRQLAKQFDSYQWKKLFWFGAGMTIAAVITHDASASALVLATVCLASGAVGLIVWNVRRQRFRGAAS